MLNGFKPMYRRSFKYCEPTQVHKALVTVWGIPGNQVFSESLTNSTSTIIDLKGYSSTLS